MRELLWRGGLLKRSSDCGLGYCEATLGTLLRGCTKVVTAGDALVGLHTVKAALRRRKNGNQTVYEINYGDDSQCQCDGPHASHRHGVRVGQRGRHCKQRQTDPNLMFALARYRRQREPTRALRPLLPCLLTHDYRKSWNNHSRSGWLPTTSVCSPVIRKETVVIEEANFDIHKNCLPETDDPKNN